MVSCRLAVLYIRGELVTVTFSVGHHSCNNRVLPLCHPYILRISLSVRRSMYLRGFRSNRFLVAISKCIL